MAFKKDEFKFEIVKNIAVLSIEKGGASLWVTDATCIFSEYVLPITAAQQ